ncbi:ComF family protein [Planococcus sp. N028]|uniref:ComF family protein n=1 Tax=Planococcus shixiaomingii TaxID=3058393 RepID=A0ABT8N0W6_9BACL|nr:ComF family protein [Planococcus sp. N028]MDN7241518.1 ComF family protein [Planococcus sp. N028]
MNCYLCEQELPFLPSWRGLFLNEIQQVVCERCKGGFEKINGTVCPICSAPSDSLCKDCIGWETTEYAALLQCGKSLYYYNKPMQNYLHQYKFLQDVVLSEVFASELQEELGKTKATIVPIPMHPDKLRERTFSQVDQMLEAAGLSYLHLLAKSKQVQGKKTKKERMASSDLFTWNGITVPEKILLIDDLYTTGTTIRHAAKVLKRAGAAEISFFSLIRS